MTAARATTRLPRRPAPRPSDPLRPVVGLGHDRVGEDVLGAGDTVDITIADGREDCEYDFLAVFEDEEGESYEIMHEAVEVCDGESYVYTE